MKILFFTIAMIKGGAERVISTLCNGELGKDNNVELLTIVEDVNNYYINPNIRRYGMMPFDEYKKDRIKRLPKTVSLYRHFINQIKPDVIIAILPEPCFIAGFMRKKMNIPVIGSERANPYVQYQNPIYHILAEWLYAKADGFIFQTYEARDYFNKKIKNRSVIIGNPIPMIKAKRDIKSVAKKIVTVGRFIKEKNYPLLVKAFSMVHKKHPDFYLVFYGKEDDGSIIRQLIHDMELDNYAVIMGECDDIHDQIKNAYMFVSSSISEGMPNALMEAMAIGLPVVATDCPSGGARRLIKNGKNGFLVDNNNAAELAAAMMRLITYPILAEKLGNEARNIINEYSEDIIGRQWLSYMKTIVRRNNGNV